LHRLSGGAWLGSLREHLIASTSLSHVVARATTVVEGLLATLTTVLTAILTTAVLVGALALVPLALLAISTAHLAAVTTHTTILVVLTRHAVKVLHEVLLHFVETALLTLLVQLLGGHPELN